MPVDDGRLTPSQLRGYTQVEDLCRRAAIDLTRLNAGGVPLEQEEMRLQHLLNACEAIKAHNDMIVKQMMG